MATYSVDSIGLVSDVTASLEHHEKVGLRCDTYLQLLSLPRPLLNFFLPFLPFGFCSFFFSFLFFYNHLPIFLFDVLLKKISGVFIPLVVDLKMFTFAFPGLATVQS